MTWEIIKENPIRVLQYARGHHDHERHPRVHLHYGYLLQDLLGKKLFSKALQKYDAVLDYCKEMKGNLETLKKEKEAQIAQIKEEYEKRLAVMANYPNRRRWENGSHPKQEG